MVLSPSRSFIKPQARVPSAATDSDDISYAAPSDPFLKRVIIRAIEYASGQPALKRMYLERKHHPVPGESFWNAAVRKLRLDISYNADALREIPANGPAVIVANHPFGVIDGLVACWLVAQVRSDFKVLAHALLYRAEELRPFMLPIDFEETRAARETNVKSRAEATAVLKRGGAMIVFPSGMVSTTPTLLARRAVDQDWKTFTARMIAQGKADVVPIYFQGQNSWLFQVASHISMTLRLSLLLKEAHDRMGSHIALRIGKRIPYQELAANRDRRELMKSLRDRTYTLA